MSKELHLGLNKFINIYRLVAPLFACVLMSWPPTPFMIILVLTYLLPALLIWIAPVDCDSVECRGQMRVSTERVSFWSVEYRYKCDSCSAVYQAKIFNPNIEVTAEFS
jgi:hypothetical protein